MDQYEVLKKRIERARELLKEIHHVAIATVNNDGSPHNSPVFMAFDDQLNGYWASHPESRHSKNIVRDDRIFLVVFDSREGHGGLFIEAEGRALEEPDRVRHGFAVLEGLKKRFYGSMGNIDGYLEDGTQRIYCARPLRAWVNTSEKTSEGVIIKDNRHEISLANLR